MESAASAKVEEGVWLASTHPAAGTPIKAIIGPQLQAQQLAESTQSK
jgi:hypothetical protein